MVGAGFAGLTAARELTRQGHDVLVFEGRDRVGGRSFTGSVAGLPADMGGAFVGPTQDAVLALAACSEAAQSGGGSAEPGRLMVPTIVIAGARDEIAGDPQTLADAIPGARAVSLPACDHFSAIPHALFKAAVFDFLDGWMEEM